MANTSTAQVALTALAMSQAAIAQLPNPNQVFQERMKDAPTIRAVLEFDACFQGTGADLWDSSKWVAATTHTGAPWKSSGELTFRGSEFRLRLTTDSTSPGVTMRDLSWCEQKSTEVIHGAGPKTVILKDAPNVGMLRALVAATILDGNLFQETTSLLDLANAGRLTATTQSESLLSFVGQPGAGLLQDDDVLEGDLDLARQGLPVRVRLSSKKPGGCWWEMRVLESASIGGRHVAVRAAVAFVMPAESPPGSVNVFRLEQPEVLPNATTADLCASVPTSDARIFDYLSGELRVLDAGGSILSQQKLTSVADRQDAKLKLAAIHRECQTAALTLGVFAAVVTAALLIPFVRRRSDGSHV